MLTLTSIVTASENSEAGTRRDGKDYVDRDEKAHSGARPSVSEAERLQRERPSGINTSATV